MRYLLSLGSITKFTTVCSIFSNVLQLSFSLYNQLYHDIMNEGMLTLMKLELNLMMKKLNPLTGKSQRVNLVS